MMKKNDVDRLVEQVESQQTVALFGINNTSDAAAKVSELNEILLNTGVSLEINNTMDHCWMHKNMVLIKLFSFLKKIGICRKTSYLVISVDHCQLHKYKTRNAGRGQSADYRRLISECEYTVGDIKRMKQTMKHDDIIKLIGISRASYYRAWRAAQDLADNEPFLNFK